MSKLHYVKLEPVGPFPEAEPVEAVGTENVDNLPFPEAELVEAGGNKEGYFLTYPLQIFTSKFQFGSG